MTRWVQSAVGRHLARAILATAVLLAATIVGSAASRQAAVAATSPVIVQIKPARFADTRAGQKTIDGRYAGWGPIARRGQFAVAVTGRAGVPDDAAAAMLNITVVRPDGPGHVTVFPCGTRPPTVSNLNYNGGDVVAKAVLSKVGTGGQICIFSFAQTEVVVDVSAYVPAGGSPTPINPVRNLDTRQPGKENPGRLKGGAEYRFTIAGRSGVPADASAAMMNITAVRPSGLGHVTVYPCETKRPTVSSINYNGGDVASNAVLAKLDTNGEICVYSVRATDLLIDVNAFVPKEQAPLPIDPVRYVDSRAGQTTIDGKYQGTGRLIGGREYKFVIGGRPGVTSSALAAMMNITAVRPDGPGHVTVYPCGTTRPNVSSINYQGNDVTPNAVLAALGEDQAVCVFSLRSTDLIIDVNAYVPSPPDVVLPPTTSSTTTTTTTTLPPKPVGCVVDGKSVTTTVTAKECAALVAFYSSLGGANWSNQQGWNTATDPCGWYGVTCKDGHVSGLAFVANNMVGELPPEIGDLTYLEGLNLSSDQIRGAIPLSIGGLANLQQLRLSQLQLDGAVPAAVATLTNLTKLSLDGNQLSGQLPDDLGNLAKLQYLDISGTDIGGSLPSGIEKLTSLEYLVANRTKLDGQLPVGIGSLANLRQLSINNSSLTGEIPSEIGKLGNLESLDLSENDIAGPIPDAIGTLTALTALKLQGNRLNGAIPSTIGNLVAVNQLDLSDNQLAGAVPLEITGIQSTNVKLFGNGCLTATDPTLVAWLELRDADWDDGCAAS